MDFAPAPARGEGGRRADRSRGGWGADGAPTGADHKGEAIGAARLPQIRRGMSNCDFVTAKSLIDLAASRLALRAPALRAATALTRPNRSDQLDDLLAGRYLGRAN